GFDDLEVQTFQDTPCDLANDARVIDYKTCSHFSLCFFQIPDGIFSIATRVYVMPPVLCREHVRHDFEDAIDVEDDHELAVEAVHAAGEFGHAGIEVDGVFLAAVIGELEHLADLVDQQAVGFAAQVDADRHRRLAVVVFGQAEPGAHVDHGDDDTAQIEHT